MNRKMRRRTSHLIAGNLKPQKSSAFRIIEDSNKEDPKDFLSKKLENNLYRVHFEMTSFPGDLPKIPAIIVSRKDGLPITTREELQMVKNQIIGAEYTCVEIFPPQNLFESRQNNERSLLIMPNIQAQDPNPNLGVQGTPAAEGSSPTQSPQQPQEPASAPVDDKKGEQEKTAS